jgi:hypothetical protein
MMNTGIGTQGDSAMEWKVFFDDEFKVWFEALEQGLQDEIWACIGLLKSRGPNLSRPRVDSIKGSAFSNMKELRVQYKGDPWRILFAFDPKRNAILLVGGNKTGKKNWYKSHIPIADERFSRHLERLDQLDQMEKD